MEFSIPLSGKNEPLFTDALFLRDKVTLDPKQKFRERYVKYRCYEGRRAA
jgi:hypothetical protein